MSDQTVEFMPPHFYNDRVYPKFVVVLMVSNPT
jgi:hypothetical protein